MNHVSRLGSVSIIQEGNVQVGQRIFGSVGVHKPRSGSLRVETGEKRRKISFPQAALIEFRLSNNSASKRGKDPAGLRDSGRNSMNDGTGVLGGETEK